MKVTRKFKKPNGKEYVEFYDDDNNHLATEIKSYYNTPNKPDRPKVGIHRSTGHIYIFDKDNPNNIKKITPSKVKGFGSGVLDDLTFGFNDELIAEGERIFSGRPNYKSNVERRRAIKKARRDHNPTSYLVGNLLGTAPLYFTGVGLAKGGVKLAKKTPNLFKNTIKDGIKPVQKTTRTITKPINYVTRNIISGTRGGARFFSPASKKALQKEMSRAFPDTYQRISKNMLEKQFKKDFPEYKELLKNKKPGDINKWFKKIEEKYPEYKFVKDKKPDELTYVSFNNVPTFERANKILKNNEKTHNSFWVNPIGGAITGTAYGVGSGEGAKDSVQQGIIGAVLGAGTGALHSTFHKIFPKNTFIKNKQQKKIEEADFNIKKLLGLSDTNENQLARKKLIETDNLLNSDQNKFNFKNNKNIQKKYELERRDFKNASDFITKNKKDDPLFDAILKRKTHFENKMKNIVLNNTNSELQKQLIKKNEYINGLFSEKNHEYYKPFIKELYNDLDTKAKNNFTLPEREILSLYFRTNQYNPELNNRVKKIISPLLLQKETFFDKHQLINNPVESGIDYRELGLKDFLNNVIKKDDIINDLGDKQKGEKLANSLIETLEFKDNFPNIIAKQNNKDYIDNNVIDYLTGEKVKSNLRKEIEDRSIENIRKKNRFIISRIMEEGWQGILSSIGIDPTDSRRLLSYLRDRGDSIQEIQELIDKANKIENLGVKKQLLNSYLINKNKVLAPYKLHENFSQE